MQHDNNLWNILYKAYQSYPNEVAVVDKDKRFTYEQVLQRVNQLANWMTGLGFVPNDRIAVLLPNCLEYFECYYALAGAGLILTSINYRLHAKEIQHILNDSQAKALVIHSQFADKEQVLDIDHLVWVGDKRSKNIGPRTYCYDDIVKSNTLTKFKPAEINSKKQVAQLYYTSGTTSKPKGVMLTHANVYIHALGALQEFSLNDKDHWLHVAPMFHLADAWAVFSVTLAGGAHVMLAKFTSSDALAIIEREKITISNLVPTMLNSMVKDKHAAQYDYSSLRLILSGGASIAPSVVKEIMSLFKCHYCQTYGLTETSPFLTVSLIPDNLRYLSEEKQLLLISKTGRSFVTVDLRVVDLDQKQIPADGLSVGEIQAKGDTVTPGYWSSPAATRDAFTEDGWFKTGDLATIDEFAYLNIVDRIKNLIITGGENVYTIEVEARIYEHSAVYEAAVFGLSDEKWGEIVAAAIVLKPDQDTQKIKETHIIEFCAERLAHFKTPKKIFFLKRLPKTGSGKILKRKLKTLYR